MTTQEKNREVACTIDKLVAAFYDEVDILPLSMAAKHALIMVMVSDTMTRNGSTVTFNLPPRKIQKEAARPPQTPSRPPVAVTG